MTDFPTLEERVAALETLQSVSRARIEEMARDINVSFKDQVRYQVNLEEHIDNGFNEVKASMATKEDIAAMDARMLAMETRILDAFKQLATIIADKRE